MNARAIIIIVAVTVIVILVMLWYKQNSETMAAQTDKNVQAFLQVIRKAEGTAGPNGYRTMFTGKLFTDFSKHPNVKNCITYKGNRLCSTAAGAYQFLFSTWKYLQTKLGLSDFSPANQDLAAIELIRQEGALEDVKAGRFAVAIDKVQNIWASLPDVPGGEASAGYGQPQKKLAELTTIYTQNGGTLA